MRISDWSSDVCSSDLPVIQGLLERDVPIFGICLGHQMLGLAAGAKTVKMHQGHRGANHPVQRAEDGVVEITSMNHGFAVDAATLPDGVEIGRASCRERVCQYV